MFVLSFQYQKGAIKTANWPARSYIKTTFQYQKGAIKTPAPRGQIHMPPQNFNTKKVRLKHHLRRGNSIDVDSFQYQKGAIKTQYALSVQLLHYEFQYQKSAIKTARVAAHHTCHGHFNTKKVRLKRRSSGQSWSRCCRFQYQKGAIKTHPILRLLSLPRHHFNTKKVRLKRALSLRSSCSSIGISIPKRCD